MVKINVLLDCSISIFIVQTVLLVYIHRFIVNNYCIICRVLLDSGPTSPSYAAWLWDRCYIWHLLIAWVFSLYIYEVFNVGTLLKEITPTWMKVWSHVHTRLIKVIFN